MVADRKIFALGRGPRHEAHTQVVKVYESISAVSDPITIFEKPQEGQCQIALKESEVGESL